MPSLSVAALPRRVDTIVVGSGPGGSALTARLVEAGERVLLLEAGPDYGHLDLGRWPTDLVDAVRLPTTHQWGYTSGDRYQGRTISFDRARVIGGCSSHNGCAAIWGSRLDYDAWRDLGNQGWGTHGLLPYFRRVSERLRVRIPALRELAPFHRTFHEAAVASGVPAVDDLNDLDEDQGVAPSPANIFEGVRWNAAFAYLDPVRARPGCMIAGNALVDRVLLEQGRVRGVLVVDRERSATRTVAADRVVVAAGAYGSPAVLLRSGIGDPSALAEAGVQTVHDLPGVGRNLHDHPAARVQFAGTEELRRQTLEMAATAWVPDEQVIAKVRSAFCERGFDLHVYTYARPSADAPGGWEWSLVVACMTPRSRGEVSITSTDPSAPPALEHAYLEDHDGADIAVLREGVAIAQVIGGRARSLLGPQISPDAGVAASGGLDQWLRRTCEHYFHPVGTCKMGPAGDPTSVVDACGAVHGLTGLYVADASIMPVIPRANTNVPTAVIGERIATLL